MLSFTFRLTLCLAGFLCKFGFCISDEFAFVSDVFEFVKFKFVSFASDIFVSVKFACVFAFCVSALVFCKFAFAFFVSVSADISFPFEKT